MTVLKLSRIAAIAIGIYSALSAVGGLMIGFYLPNGAYIAFGCLMAGAALTCYLWWSLTRDNGISGWDLLGRAGFSGAAGLALYSNVCWGLWALGVPLELGIVRDGRMGEHYWLGPATLVYAVFCYATIKWPNRTRQGEKS